MKFSFTTVSSLLVLSLTTSNVIAAPVAAPEPASGRVSAAGKTVGSTVLAASVGTALSTFLNCLEHTKSKKLCFGVKSRDLEIEDVEEVQPTEEDEEQLSALVARASGSASAGARAGSVGKAVGTTVGTTVLGTLVSTTLAPIFRCLESGKGKKACFGLKKRSDEAATTETTEAVADDELHPDTVEFLQYLQTLAKIDDAAVSEADEATIAARSPKGGSGFKGAAKAVGSTAGSAAGGALITNLTNCFLNSSLKKCFKSIF